MSYNKEVEDIELQLLLEAIYLRYGADFRNYAMTSLRRRIWNVVRAEQLTTISGLQEKILHEPSCMERFSLLLSVNVTAMFRDPNFFLALRNKVVPLLRTYPFIRIWSVGCSTGEEVYSMAILLEEEGLIDRCRIYATDMNEAVLRIAKEGIFPFSDISEYANNYLKAGGKKYFSDYYTAGYDHIIFRPPLKRSITFAQHNLTVDASFNEFHLILCRNVMIYFNRVLQASVHKLLYESLTRSGILCLGARESLRLTSHENNYEELSGLEKIYRRLN